VTGKDRNKAGRDLRDLNDDIFQSTKFVDRQLLDLMMVVTGKNKDTAGQRNLDDEIYQSMKFIDRQLSNRGGHPTKLIGFQDAIELVMVLPGKVARETRVQIVQGGTRALGLRKTGLVKGMTGLSRDDAGRTL